MATNLKWVLTCFEQVSGMRINFDKSEMIPLNLDPDEITNLGEILGCPIGKFPIKYLGVPLHVEKLSREDLQPLLDKILKRIAGWRGKLLSYKGRLTLIKTCLASIPVYLLSFFKFPKWALDMINSQMANCLWNDYEGHRKIHLANWQMVCMKQEFGGLGIPNLHDLNICLLGSLVKRYMAGEGKIWKFFVDFKYLKTAPNIFCGKTLGTSQFWKGVMWAAKAVKMGSRWIVGEGAKIRFWEDSWFGTSPLTIQFWDLYCICREQCNTIQQVWDGQTLRISFRRVFDDQMMLKWFELEEIARSIVLTENCDSLVWQYEASGQYSSSSLYTVINFRGVTPVFLPAVWKITVPPRVHVFLWLLFYNKLMTRDNLLKRNLKKPEDCVFCSCKESICHLFFECVVAQEIWTMVSCLLGRTVGGNIESVASLWVAGKQLDHVNTICSAVLWAIWKFRNNMIFNGVPWISVKQIWWLVLRLVKKWKVIYKEHMMARLENSEDQLQQLPAADNVGVMWARPGLDTKHPGLPHARGVVASTPSPVSTLDFGFLASPVCM